MEMLEPKTPSTYNRKSPAWLAKQISQSEEQRRGNVNSLSTVGTDPNNRVCVTRRPEVVKREREQ